MSTVDDQTYEALISKSQCFQDLFILEDGSDVLAARIVRLNLFVLLLSADHHSL